ncbi:MAG: alanine--tRNA ligase [Oscillospiraceae bacterium]
MEWTGLNELREKYLSFFESKGHLRLQSFSLIPQNDKSLLLINSGMAPMKKYFTGELTPPKKRVTTCQKCIRTPDIERVGKTARHGTYFEMLGNFSFGDYFKKDATAWAWEFCTKIIKMDADKIYITVYEEDDEAYNMWVNDIGVEPSHMIRFGKEDNFWEHGAGPCGPCSELHYDRGEKYGCGKPDCKVGCECDRYVEFWNLVFTQFENDGNNNYTRLEHPNIDTGMGLERLACITQGVDNIFEVDTFQSIMKHIMKIANVEYHNNEKTDVSLRVITDHIRSTTMMIGDGVMPSNSGRGYVLRRLLRRAARHGRLLGINNLFLYDVAETVIKENAKAYPNLIEKHDFIINVIKSEEENFAITIDTGLLMLEQMLDKADFKELGAEDAFKLSDTYGFPIDLTKELLEEKGMTVDEDGFNKLVLKQRQTAKDAQAKAGAEAWKGSENATVGMKKTEFLGYDTFKTNSKIEAVIVNGKITETASSDDSITLVLDKTPFYAQSGGQVGDVGLIIGDGFVFEVENTTKTHDGVILHNGIISDGETISVSNSVSAEIDESSRLSTMRNHTAAHLLQAALRSTLGNHIEQAGQLVNSSAVRFDFTHFSALTNDELKTVEDKINNVIMQALAVTTTEMSIDEAKKQGAMALFGEKYGKVVRVVKAGDFSTELCGGTHVKNTGNIGLFKIISEASVASGVRRIEAVTGENVIKFINNNLEIIYKTAENIKASNIAELPLKAASIMADLKSKEKDIEALKSEVAGYKTSKLVESAIDVDGLRLIVAFVGEESSENVKAYCEKAKSYGENVVAVIAGINKEKKTISFACAANTDAIKRGVHAGNMVREIAKIAGGSGGGKPDLAMAGGKDFDKIDDALFAADNILKTFLK